MISKPGVERGLTRVQGVELMLSEVELMLSEVELMLSEVELMPREVEWLGTKDHCSG
ncbi:MAG: hypothetical protein ACYCV4_15805 [Dermatophilaceae bacterium]